MKKTKLITFGLCAILLFAAPLVSCANGTSDDSSSKKSSKNETPETPSGENGDEGGSSSTSRQGQIDNAANGASITLSSDFTDTKLSISKPITIDGNNIEGLEITVSPSVQSNVKLKNLKNSKIRIASDGGSGNSSVNKTGKINFNIARGAGGDNGAAANPAGNGEDADGFKKFGDDALPLFLENCSIDEFEIKGDVALYLEKGDKKTTIDELTLKNGVEDFTFIEFDEGETTKESKSKVKDFIIEDDGIKEINLIGGTFNDIDCPNNLSNSVEFKYDKEFADQLDFETAAKKADFMTKAEPKDIALAKNEVKNGDYNVYKFQMDRTEFEMYNGYFDIIFLTAEQVNAIISGQNSSQNYMDLITYDTPAYDMSLMGAFTVAKNENGTIENGHHAVYGASQVFLDYSHIERDANGYPVMGMAGIAKTVTLEKYMTYSKDAVVVNVGDTVVDIYVNKSAIRKSDLLLCSGYGRSETVTGQSEGGTKLSNIDLEDYIPYFTVNTTGIQNAGRNEQNAITNHTAISVGSIEVPTADKTAFERNYLPFTMSPEDASAYPDVSNVDYPDIIIPNTKITVKYYNDSLVYQNSERVIRENIAPNADSYEYYFDSDFTEMLHCDADFVLWDDIYAAKNWTENTEVTIYARPLRNITLVQDNLINPGEATRLTQMNFDSDNSGFKLFTSYNASTDTYSGLVTNPKNIVAGNTYYVAKMYYKLWIIGTESGTEPMFYKRWLDSFVIKNNITNVDTPVAMYSSSVVNENNKLTADDIDNAEFGMTIYMLSPKVKFDQHFENGTYVNSGEMWFADFYALICSESNTDTYYYAENGHDEQGMSITNYGQITKAYLDEYIASPTFYAYGDILFYTSDPSQN